MRAGYGVGMRDVIAQRLERARRRLERIEASRNAASEEVADLETALRVIDSIEKQDAGPARPAATVADRIIDALKQLGRPSARPAIAEFLDNQGEPVKDNTLSGTLARLSRDQRIIHHDGAWWLMEWWQDFSDGHGFGEALAVDQETAEAAPQKKPFADLSSNDIVGDSNETGWVDNDDEIPF